MDASKDETALFPNEDSYLKTEIMALASDFGEGLLQLQCDVIFFEIVIK